MEMNKDIEDEILNTEAQEPESPAEPTYVLEDGRELYEHFRFEADKGQQLLRVDKFLVERMEKTSRNRIQQAADAECIIVNGRPVKSSYKVKPGDVISIVMDRPRYDFEIIAEDIPLDIVYEDEFLLVVNKPPGLVVHPDMAIIPELLSTPSHIISRIRPIMMSATRVSALYTVLTRILQDFWLWRRHRRQRQCSASSSSTRPPAVSMWRWCGAISRKTAGL